ncbi:MAG: [protein-PII] uridylyltransferase [Planctomycetes bacterium]|nr:[protein-PII] uridylyltransferase [Planctomycetota bacterium]
MDAAPDGAIPATAPGPGFPQRVVAAAAAVRALQAGLAEQRAQGRPAVAAAALAAERLDAIVTGLWEAIDTDPALAVRCQATLVAQGGYGRDEIVPWSDVDLLILHEPDAGAAVAAATRRLVQDLFDAGLQVGQGVRTVAEARRMAGTDATIFTAAIDARPLAGPPERCARLRAGLATMARRRWRRVGRMLLEARGEERAKHGDTVALLEPNVKRSSGGLRDVQLVGWLGFILHGTSRLDDLTAVGFLTPRDAAVVREANEFLLGLRIDLHLAAGRNADELSRDDQLRVAAARGIADRDGELGVERFMRDYFRHTRGVARIVAAIAARFDRPGVAVRAVSGVLGHRVDRSFRVGPLDVGLLPDARGAVGDPATVCRLVELATIYQLPIEPATWEVVRTAAAPPTGGSATTDPLDPATRERFLALFATPAGLATALRRLHDVALLERIVPAVAHARDLLQFNNYHKYTVDEHSIRAVEEAVRFGTGPGWLGEVWRGIGRPRPLLMALLLHDLGKGFVEDHSEVGARLAAESARRLALPDDEARVVEFLVRRHLAMAHLAFRRDSADPGLVVAFARDVGSPEVLRMLTLLTAADVAAVGPGTWTRWKADLLGDLYHRTLAYLDGEVPSRGAERHRHKLDALLAGGGHDARVAALARDLPLAYLRDTPPERILRELDQLVRLPAQGIHVQQEWDAATATLSITVATREDVAPGVFHRLTGALTSQRLEILAAAIHTLPGGHVVDRFVVHDPDQAGEPPRDRLAEIAAALRQALRADVAPAFARIWNPFAPRPAAGLPVRVVVDTGSSAESTIVEVFANDRPGLLYEVARALFTAGLSVKSAKIGTVLDQVVDAFHVVEADGAKPTDPERLEALRRAVEQAASPVVRP